MDLEQEFDRRIAAIHGLGQSIDDSQIPGDANPVDVRHAEFQAMADVFLGKDYDPAKTKRVENLQIALQHHQAALAQRLNAGELQPNQYLDACNDLIASTFRKCEEVLGAEDFRKLFGSAPNELGDLIDRQTFLAAQKP
jgi:hypothetical protein